MARSCSFEQAAVVDVAVEKCLDVLRPVTATSFTFVFFSCVSESCASIYCSPVTRAAMSFSE